MVKKFALTLLIGCLVLSSGQLALGQEDGWISLFDGKSFDGWKVHENKDTFSIRDGMIVVDGPRGHLFYVGPVNNANFKNFELKVDVMTKPNANSGIYFHTEYQDSGWPAKGYEVQVNNSHSDWRRTGSLWAVRDVREGVKDNEWFTEHIIVKGKHIVIKVNDKTVVDWIEPENWTPPEGMAGRKISSGTFALQGHDPKSVIYYKNIRCKPLCPDIDDSQEGWYSLFDGTLSGWKASENKDTFSVKDGLIVAHGPRSHLFYVGPVNDANFTNFEFKAKVMTQPSSNSGIYIHTEYQEKGWPGKGYECQVNTTHSDRKKTGGLYGVVDVIDNAPSKDGEWFDYYIRVEGKHVIIRINGHTTVAWTEPDDWSQGGRKISNGTIALQGHDPKSTVYYKDIMIRPLAEHPW